MAKYRVDTEVLQSKAKEIRGIKTEHENVIAKLGTIVTALADVWEGQAYQSFVSNYENMKPTFTNLASALEAVAADLDNDAAAYAQAEATASKS